MAIRWREQDLHNLRRAVKRFNAKIDRIARKNPQAKEYLPEKMSVKKISGEVTERKDFNRILKSVDRFMKRGAENLTTLGNGVVVTKYEKRELQYARQSVNARRAAQRRRAGEISGAGIGTVQFWENQPIKNLSDVKQENFQNFVDRLKNQVRESSRLQQRDQFLANWTQALFNVFGDNLANQILQETENIDRRKLVDMLSVNPAADIEFIYSAAEGEALAARLIEEIRLL